ncbi:alternate F1F0 ATPase, F1 subunit alpha [Desulfohalovibrio reitneri]|uniref:alternate F1F0 ATPase, F1 subunit alpha n=1 Tax=Desulfohalovibrio reitneri TaxID=1307759 RepID=UPI0009E0990A|nr:alternate F1F0 ATPase, F1 subunit alpha [Desulfohalovibrio reitneri]
MTDESGLDMLRSALNGPLVAAREAADAPFEPVLENVGRIRSIGEGVARVRGLRGVRSEELISFRGGRLGLALNVDENETGVVMLDPSESLGSGDEARRTGRVLDTLVGPELRGRVVDPRGRPLDDKGPLRTADRLPVERPAPAIMDRAPVQEPLQTGLKVVDALIPVGRGQRELILGDRQTGKTAVALDTVLNQKNREVFCIYCGVGKRASAMAKVIATLRENGAIDYSCVVMATEEDPPGLQFAAPYAAMSMGERIMEEGGDALVILDDLTRHARAYRELSLLLRRPPGREAFPGDIFYIHSRLLERSTHLSKEQGGGSLTALPIIETEAQNISAYIPTNLISITDGQIYLSPDLFQKAILPAVDVGRSVSRVGGKTQLPAYRAVAGDLKLAYSQFEELEAFSRFGTRLDEETRQTLERGKRVREVLKQDQYSPLPVMEQLAQLIAVNQGVLDDLPLDGLAFRVAEAAAAVVADMPDLSEKVLSGKKLDDAERERVAGAMADHLREEAESKETEEKERGSTESEGVKSEGRKADSPEEGADG